MRRSIVSTFVCLLYLGAGLCFGEWSHHHSDEHGAAGGECAACHWSGSHHSVTPQVGDAVLAAPETLGVQILAHSFSAPCRVFAAAYGRAPPV